MTFHLHNNEGIRFPPILPMFQEGEEFFGRFHALIPRGARDSVIGVGGTGMIHLVRDTLLDRQVALKIPLREVRRDPGARQDVLRETRHAVELTHPNIVRIHDFHEDAGGWGISMQYIRGKNLDELRHDDPASGQGGVACFFPERVAVWLAQLLDALTYAHEVSGMVHRDIKPRNLMLEADEHAGERVLITDFGITRKLRVHSMLLSRAQPAPGGPETMGTLPYMSLSQIQGEPPSPLDDIYSVGATIYELLTGRPPFFEGGYEQIRVQIETVVPPSMAMRRSEMGLPDTGIPREWETAVAACLEKDPANRPPSIRELTAALGLAPGAPPSVSPPAEPDSKDREKAALRNEIDELNRNLEELRSSAETAGNQLAEHRTAAETALDALAGKSADLDAALAREADLRGEIERLTATGTADPEAERSRMREEIERSLRRATARPLAEAMARIAVLEKLAGTAKTR